MVLDIMECEMNMKVIIISQQPINSICGMAEFQKRLAQEGHAEVSRLQYSAGERRDIIGEIKALHPDLLITTDLAGFEQCTLADNISYNLLDCKQIHLLLHEKLPNEPYLKGQLSIAMFFYCAGDAYCDYLTQKYPRLPWLKKLPDWQEGTDQQAQESHAEALGAVFREVLQECGLRP